MAHYPEPTSKVEAARWTAFAKLPTQSVREIIADNDSTAAELIGTSGLEFLARSLDHETSYLRALLQDRGLTLSGV